MSRRLGLITIGQTPRPDFEAAFRTYAAPDVEISVCGALDDLALGEIERLAGTKGEYPLLVRVAGGRGVEIPMGQLLPRVEACALQLAGAGAALIVVLCAGDFPDVQADGVPVLLPGRLVPAVVGSLCRSRVVGVVTPIVGQLESARRKWTADGFQPNVVAASPLAHDEIATAARALGRPEIELVVLDCMGHDEAYRREFQARCGRPVLAAQSLVARVAGELV